MLDYHVDRLQSAGVPVFVATTTNVTDDPIVDALGNCGVGVFRGSESDVLARFIGCAQANGLDAVVRVTSDCPLIDGGVVGAAISQFMEWDDPWVYLTNTQRRTFPRGMDFEIFSMEALLEAGRSALRSYEREHVTPYFYEGGNPAMVMRSVERPVDKSSYRLTLDTSADFDLLSRLIDHFGAAGMACDEIVEVLDSHPELVAVNADTAQKQLHG